MGQRSLVGQRSDSLQRRFDFVKQEIRKHEIAKLKQDLLFVTMHKNVLSKKEFMERVAQLQKFATISDEHEHLTEEQEEDAYRKLKADLDRYLIFVEDKRPMQSLNGGSVGQRSVSAMGPSVATDQILKNEKEDL